MNMRILHFGSNYLPNKGGNVVRMVHMLENNKHSDMDIYIMTTAQGKDFDDNKYYLKTGIKIIRINSLNEAKTLLPVIVTKYKINIVVTHIIPANIIACRYLPKDIKIMTEIHSLIDSGKLKNMGKALLHKVWLNRRTSKYFVLSKTAGKYIEKNYGVKKEKIVFLPNGCNVPEYGMKKGNPKYVTFGYAGTFYKWQGIEILYNNIDKILNLADNIRIILIGGGELEEEFKVLASKYEGRLVVTGLIPQEEVENYMKEIDILMIPRPSTLETETAIPLKIFDSVEYGKPVIISDVKGLTEVLSEKEAFVFKAGDSQGLVNICNRAYNHPEECEKRFLEAYKKISLWPSWTDIQTIQYNAFIEDLKC